MPREMIFLIASPIVIAIVLLVAWLLWTRRRPRIRRRALAVVAVLFLAASWWSQWFWLGQVPRFLFLHEEFGGLLRYALVMRPGIAEGDADDQSLLEGAIEERNRVVLERLLAAGLAVDNRLRPGQGLPDWLRQDDDDGDDPCAKPPPTRELGLIHEAARTGDRGLVELLLEHGAELELQDSYGWTPLHHAVEAHGP